MLGNNIRDTLRGMAGRDKLRSTQRDLLTSEDEVDSQDYEENNAHQTAQ